MTSKIHVCMVIENRTRELGKRLSIPNKAEDQDKITPGYPPQKWCIIERKYFSGFSYFLAFFSKLL